VFVKLNKLFCREFENEYVREEAKKYKKIKKLWKETRDKSIKNFFRICEIGSNIQIETFLIIGSANIKAIYLSQVDCAFFMKRIVRNFFADLLVHIMTRAGAIRFKTGSHLRLKREAPRKEGTMSRTLHEKNS